MTFVPHLRLTMAGLLGNGGPEEFSMNISIANPDPDALVGWTNLTAGEKQDLVDDFAADCVAWFARPASKISNDAVLKSVKVAPIGANGRYSGPSVEKIVNQTGGALWANEPSRKPFQVARVVTLHTNSDLGRVTGRFYVPSPNMSVVDDGRWYAADADAAEGSDETFIDALNNQPGIDFMDYKVVVASQGRKNKDGSVRLPPGNHQVTGISVGRVPDTQRRRRNRLQEQRTKTTL